MTMNRLFVTMTLAALLCSGNVMARNAQKPEKRELTPAERMDASLKRLEGRLMLDEETAAKFAPLYKEYLEALRNCRPECPKEKGQKDPAFGYFHPPAAFLVPGQQQLPAARLS